ncbi:MAG: hypothetical protein WCF82_08420 [Microcoleus sp.]
MKHRRVEFTLICRETRKNRRAPKLEIAARNPVSRVKPRGRVEGSLWHKPTADAEEFEILLPNRENLGDYAARIREAIQTLENAENRPQLEILSELLTRIPNTTIQGIVMQIHTPNTKKLSGEITLLGLVVAKLQKIQTSLADKDYILAIKAYQERLPILCSGDLIKDNNAFILTNPHNLTLDELW